MFLSFIFNRNLQALVGEATSQSPLLRGFLLKNLLRKKSEFLRNGSNETDMLLWGARLSTGFCTMSVIFVSRISYSFCQLKRFYIL